jgi:hypothetical protein
MKQQDCSQHCTVLTASLQCYTSNSSGIASGEKKKIVFPSIEEQARSLGSEDKEKKRKKTHPLPSSPLPSPENRRRRQGFLFETYRFRKNIFEASGRMYGFLNGRINRFGLKEKKVLFPPPSSSSNVPRLPRVRGNEQLHVGPLYVQSMLVIGIPSKP